MKLGHGLQTVTNNIEVLFIENDTTEICCVPTILLLVFLYPRNINPDGPTMALLCPYYNNLKGRTERRFNKK